MKFNLPVILLFITLTACATSPDNRYYTLSSSYPVASETIAVKPGNNANMTLDAITVPDVLDRPQIILKSGQNEIEILEYDRWAEPLESMVYRILSDNLVARIGINSSAPVRETHGKRITVAIDEFDADKTGYVMLTATWAVRTGEITEHHIFRRGERADANNIRAIVATQSQLLGKLADAIANQH
jgi:uncharacterized protein